MFKVVGEGFSFRLSRLKDNILQQRWPHLVYILSDKKLYGLNQGNFFTPFHPFPEHFIQISKPEKRHNFFSSSATEAFAGLGDTQPGGEKGEGEEVKGEVEREEEEEEKQEEEEKAIESGRGEGGGRSEFSSNLPE